MTELLTILQEVSPFVAIVFLGIMYFQARKREADAKVQAADIAREAAKYRAEAETRRDERDERLAARAANEQARQLQVEEQIAVVMAQTAALLATLTTGQADITLAVSKADKRSSGQVRGAQKDILVAIDIVRELITEALGVLTRQEDQPDAIARIERALAALKEAADETNIKALTAAAAANDTLPKTGTEG